MTRLRAPFTPPAVLLMLYASLAVMGMLLLKLPIATREPISWLDAAFTATSAITITGLTTVNTGETFTRFGQIVILVLIQLGGLGIMTFTVRVLSAFGMHVGLRQRIALGEDLNQTSVGDLFALVKTIFVFVLMAEIAGAILLAFRFVPDFGWADGIWAAVFFSVSTVNNAGFAIFPGSLSAYAADPLVNLVVPALFVFGGLGYTVLYDLNRVRRWRGLNLHTKLMLAGTAGLIAVSVPATLALEWTNSGTLGGLPADEKLMAGWFQALTTRSAGFNTVPTENLRDSTSFMFVILMIIGGGSTSTAGGMKVTTFVVLLLATIAFVRGQDRVHAFNRELGERDILNVLALGVVTVSLFSLAAFLLILTQEGELIDILFDTASAVATVGLSRDMVPNMDDFGQLLIMFLMFAGRVGPLAFGFALARRTQPLLRYPPGKVFIG
ncbi:TrkH family potassium uptake protein [Lutibaculum baratangense]|uniref:YubG n=1 Tax=Lutibaculum baratangense AMV1 TaxID=631454 RepID=V4RK33_9HYPH|nr:TrkH family potassium uptake protein [Lutibaculum baratangense]ESR25694.1 YubG [Lutibaculum baratangense AMV1]